MSRRSSGCYKSKRVVRGTKARVLRAPDEIVEGETRPRQRFLLEEFPPARRPRPILRSALDPTDSGAIGQDYVVTVWTGRTATSGDRAALLHALTSVHPAQ